MRDPAADTPSLLVEVLGLLEPLHRGRPELITARLTDLSTYLLVTGREDVARRMLRRCLEIQ